MLDAETEAGEPTEVDRDLLIEIVEINIARRNAVIGYSNN